VKKPATKKLQQPPVLIAAITVGVLLVALIGWFGLVRPQSGQVKRLKAEQVAVQRQIDDLRAKTTAAQGAPKIHVADIYRLAKAMPSKTDMPDLLLELSQLARASGVEFNAITPAPATALAGYSVIPITVSFNGNFFNLADFLYRLRTLVDVHNGGLEATGRLFSVDTLSFAEGLQKFPSVKAELLIDAFVYGTDVPGAAQGVVPAATPTDTTSTTTTPTDTTSTTSTEPPASASAAGAP
jgi:type IV pilus assembly protein PilO